MTKEEICKKALKYYGHLFQLTMMEEECAELIQACTKVSRGMSIQSLIEEIGDVENMIMQMKYDVKHVYKANVDWEGNRNKKLKRFEEVLEFSEKRREMEEKGGT
jgi:NTP pyrophosphatase (non-canonical NTP hydrolase)